VFAPLSVGPECLYDKFGSSGKRKLAAQFITGKAYPHAGG